MILPSVQWTVRFLSSPGNIKIGFSEAYYSLKNVSKKMIHFPTTDSHIAFVTLCLFLGIIKGNVTAGQFLIFFFTLSLVVLYIFQ